MKKNNTIFTVIIILIIVILLLIKLLPNMLNKTNYDDLEVYKNNKLEKSIDLVAKNDVTSVFSSLAKNKFLYNVLKVLLLIAILIFIVLFIRKGKKRNKKKNIYSKNRRRRKY